MGKRDLEIEEAEEICFAWVISPRKERKFTIKMRQNIKIGAGMTSLSDSESIKHRNSQSQTMTMCLVADEYLGFLYDCNLV